MKNRVMSLLVLTMVLVIGFTITGCSDDTEDTTDTNTVETEDATDDETNEASAYGDFEDFESVDWAKIGKYKVNELSTETNQDGVYTLVYESNTSVDKIVDYYDGLLKGTDNYLKQDIDTVGSLLKGTLNGHGITVTVQVNETEDGTLVDFFSYDSSYVAE